MSEPMFYVASWPDYPDEAFAACVDEPQYKKSTAESIAGWLERGAIIKRVTASEGKQMMDNYDPSHRHKPIPGLS